MLISHVHMDHLHVPSLRCSAGTSASLVPAGAGGLAPAQGVPGRPTETRAGDTLQIGGGDGRDRAAPCTRRARAAQPRRRRAGRLRAAGPDAPSTSPATPTCSTRWATWAPVDVALLPIWGWGPTLGEGHLDPRHGRLRAAS